VVGGSAEEGIAPAKMMGADAFVTGEAKYHTLSDAHLGGITVVAAGHYETEAPVCQMLYQNVKEWIPTAEIEIYHANTLIRL
jgi:putative NIF3 family GTP cyclohydrolase 1 type 2